MYELYYYDRYRYDVLCIDPRIVNLAVFPVGVAVFYATVPLPVGVAASLPQSFGIILRFRQKSRW